jgi:hypothetical protein
MILALLHYQNLTELRPLSTASHSARRSPFVPTWNTSPSPIAAPSLAQTIAWTTLERFHGVDGVQRKVHVSMAALQPLTSSTLDVGQKTLIVMIFFAQSFVHPVIVVGVVQRTDALQEV